MDDVVRTRLITSIVRGFASLAIVALAPAIAAAQTTASSSSTSSEPSKLWIVAGGGSTTLLGDCTGCEATTYTHTGGIVGIVGRSITPRTDAGVQIFWVPATAATGEHLRTTFIMGAFQFRPWQSKGFFLSFDMGMAFVRNWVVDTKSIPQDFTSKAFALALGGGWEWRFTPKLGGQVFAMQHVAALGDLNGNTGTVENVVGNFWTVGAGIVIKRYRE